MGHIMAMFDSDWLRACHLDGDTTLTIKAVEQGEIKSDNGEAKAMPSLSFEEDERRLGLNKTNAKTVASLYGTETDEWIGRKIIVYQTECEVGGEMRECVRIRRKAI